LQAVKTIAMEQKPETQDEVTLQLIEKIDKNFEKSLKKIYLSLKIDLRYYANFASVIYYIILFVVIVCLLSSITKQLPTMTEQPPNIQIVIGISLTATFIALASFGVNIQNLVKPENSHDVLFEYNYKVLKENVKDENVALLKGLIMLKSKHPELSLKETLELPITKDKLFEILYM
jgi:hypothetical protein